MEIFPSQKKIEAVAEVSAAFNVKYFEEKES